jgi:hypothetical protein
MGERRSAYKVLVGKADGRISLGTPRRRRKYNIKMDIKEMEWDVDWVDLTQGWERWRAVVNAVMNLQFP